MHIKCDSVKQSQCVELLVITINEPVDYMAWALMILMRGKDIMRAIGRACLAQVMSLPRSKTIKGKGNVKKQVHW